MAEPQAGPWPDVTAIWSVPSAGELQVLHSRMAEPDQVVALDPAAYLAGLKADPERAAEWEAEWADNWDSADSGAYQARVEAGLEPEAGL